MSVHYDISIARPYEDVKMNMEKKPKCLPAQNYANELEKNSS